MRATCRPSSPAASPARPRCSTERESPDLNGTAGKRESLRRRYGGDLYSTDSRLSYGKHD